MNSIVEDTLNKLRQCDDYHHRCDCLLEHSEITYLLEYIQEQEKENGILKHRLNDIVFSDANYDVELGARYLRKIDYIGFDEERKIYLNKHNNEPFWKEDEKEKNYYIPDEELDEYTKQLEYKLKQKETIIKEVREYIESFKKIYEGHYPYIDIRDLDLNKLLEILDKEK